MYDEIKMSKFSPFVRICISKIEVTASILIVSKVTKVNLLSQKNNQIY